MQLWYFCSYECTHTHNHPFTHRNPVIKIPIHIQTCFHTHTFPLPYALSLTLSDLDTLTHDLWFRHCLTYPHSYTLINMPFPILTLSFSLSPTITIMVTFTFTLTHIHFLTHTQTQTSNSQLITFSPSEIMFSCNWENGVITIPNFL